MKILSLFFVVLFSGCSIVSQEAFVVVNKSHINSYFVEHQPNDKREINKLIEARIKKQGYIIANNRMDADIIVTYTDLWYWDITNYLINLRVIFRDSKDRYPTIVGNNLRTSLARKDPEFMVDEVLTQMFEKQRD